MALALRAGPIVSLGDVRSIRPMTRRAGRTDEFEAFFVGQFESIVRSVTFVCGDAERATDAVQEAFIKAYSRWGRLRRYDEPAAWVRRIAINATRDMHRSESRRSQREQRARGPEAVVDAIPDDSALDLLAALPDRQRAVAALFYVDDLGTGEIAELLGISEGTVRFHLSEARERLRSLFGPDLEGDHAAR